MNSNKILYTILTLSVINIVFWIFVIFKINTYSMKIEKVENQVTKEINKIKSVNDKINDNNLIKFMKKFD